MALHIAGVFKDFGGGVGTVLFNHKDLINPTDDPKLPLFTPLHRPGQRHGLAHGQPLVVSRRSPSSVAI